MVFASSSMMTFLAIGFVIYILPFGLLYLFAKSRGASGMHVFWGLLGWIGLVIGFVLIGMNPPRQGSSRY